METNQFLTITYHLPMQNNFFCLIRGFYSELIVIFGKTGF